MTQATNKEQVLDRIERAVVLFWQEERTEEFE